MRFTEGGDPSALGILLIFLLTYRAKECEIGKAFCLYRTGLTDDSGNVVLRQYGHEMLWVNVLDGDSRLWRFRSVEECPRMLRRG